MNSNTFELTGKVSYLDIKYLDSGLTVTRVLLGKKSGRKVKDEKDAFETYGIDFFNDMAEEVCNKVKKGTYLNVKGKLTVDKYVDSNGKNVERVRLLGFEYTPAVYNETKKCYVAEEGDKPW